FALPLAALAIWLLSRFRARRGHPAPLRTALADVGTVAGTAPWGWMTRTPRPGRAGGRLVPLAAPAAVLAGPWATAVGRARGNLLVFAALGALLPVRTARLASPARIAAVAAAASLLVEVLQYVLRLGRVSSVDDVLINVAGAVVAAMITRRWWARTVSG